MSQTVQEQQSGSLTATTRDDVEILRSVQGAPFLKRFLTYMNLTGPGWLQSALTLGGGSLTSSLYLGVLAGFSMLWLQPLAMLLGIIMLAALGYVTMSTGERPLIAMNRHINPVLGWSWAAASLVASMVWALPQYSLAVGVTQQNLLPGVVGADSAMGASTGRVIVTLIILVVSTFVTWNYGRGGVGVRIYEAILKTVVAFIVLAFIGVGVRLVLTDSVQWGALIGGFIPDPRLIFRPAPGYDSLLAQVATNAREYWSNLLVTQQQQVMAAGFSAAVGINMTFLFGYSLLRRRWGREFLDFQKFDLAMGMLVPFMLATSCIIIAAASQFHTVPQPGFLGEEGAAPPVARQVNEYRNLLAGRIAFETGEDVSQLAPAELDTRIAQLDPADRRMAAVLVTRDAGDLARALRPITGDFFANYLFGLGVLGMALSTVTLLMAVSGMVVCEAFGKPYGGWTFRLGALMAASGALGPFIWSRASFWLAIPTSIIGLMLLPIAYVTFFLMMNRRSLLGDAMPTGRRRVIWNTLMVIALVIVLSASFYMINQQTGLWGLGALALFLAAVGIAEVVRRKPAAAG
ncbi:MAG TPA: divalent metal cation transporter [Longimicrobiales bacterium]|nr:divalent metal cation transporter [Longimicrobiales bacterium]